MVFFKLDAPFIPDVELALWQRFIPSFAGSTWLVHTLLVRGAKYGLRWGQGRRMSWAPLYRFVQQIPRGRVLTYGGLARLLRLRGGARAAGRAMAATPRGRGIPWHRIVGRGGRILLREPYASLQRRLLESEGIEVLERRVNLSKHLWKPRSSSLTRTTLKPKLSESKALKKPRLRKAPPTKPSLVL